MNTVDGGVGLHGNFVTQFNGTTDCLTFNEPGPEFSATDAGTVSGSFAGQILYSSYLPSVPFYNFSVNHTNWTSTNHSGFRAAGHPTATDPWATTSGWNGLEYFSHLEIGPTGLSCLGIGAASPAQLITGSAWSFPIACMFAPHEAEDGQVSQYDIGGTALWAAAPHLAASGDLDVYAYVAPTCRFGQPGGSLCPFADLSPADSTTLAVDLTLVAPDHHTGPQSFVGMAVSPCTHDGIVGWHSPPTDPVNPDNIIIAFVHPGPAGSAPTVHVYTDPGTIHGVAPQLPNDDCGGVGGTCLHDDICKCTGADSTDCMQGGSNSNCVYHAMRVNLAVSGRAPGDTQCFLYVTYDWVDPSLSPNRYTASLDVLDITNENAPPILKKHWDFGNGYGGSVLGSNAWGSIVAAAPQLNGPVGWFFYNDGWVGAFDSCQIAYQGFVDNNGMVSSKTSIELWGDFPALGGGAGVAFGEYNGIVRRGLNGYMYPVFAIADHQASCAGTAAGISCQGDTYIPRLVGDLVTP